MVTRNEPAWLSWHHSTLFWLIWLQIKFEKNKNNNHIPWLILLSLNKGMYFHQFNWPRKDQLLLWSSLSKAVTCDSQMNQQIYSYLNLPILYHLFSFSICLTVPISQLVDRAWKRSSFYLSFCVALDTAVSLHTLKITLLIFVMLWDQSVKSIKNYDLS